MPKLDAPNPFHNPSTRENTNHLKHPRSHWARATGSDEMSQGSEEEATWQEGKDGITDPCPLAGRSPLFGYVLVF